MGPIPLVRLNPTQYRKSEVTVAPLAQEEGNNAHSIAAALFTCQATVNSLFATGLSTRPDEREDIADRTEQDVTIAAVACYDYAPVNRVRGAIGGL